MTRRRLIAVGVFCLSGPLHAAEPDRAQPVAGVACRITGSTIAGLRSGASLGDARALMPQARFARTKDVDDVDVIEARVGGEVLWRSGVGVDLPKGGLPDSTVLTHLETFSETCRDERSVGPGTRLAWAAEQYGGLLRITKSEYEQREFAWFKSHPRGLIFRIDYSGRFAPGAMQTQVFREDAKILSVQVEGVAGLTR